MTEAMDIIKVEEGDEGGEEGTTNTCQNKETDDNEELFLEEEEGERIITETRGGRLLQSLRQTD